MRTTRTHLLTVTAAVTAAGLVTAGTGSAWQANAQPPTAAPATVAPNVASALTSASSVVVLRYGSTGELVKELQRRLKVSVDGHFGPGTMKAVKSFQSSKGLTVDGVVGPATWEALGGFPGSDDGDDDADDDNTGSGDKVIYLTFDDGPNPTYTPQVLKLLAKYKAKASFFMLGQNAAANPSLVSQVKSQGHAVGNHSWDHPQLTKLSSSALASQLSTTDTALGNGISCMRPPYGATNSGVRQAASARGLTQVLWTVDSNDWRKPGSGAIASTITSAARDGSIVLMHDGGGNRVQTVAALESVLRTLSAQGYRFATLPQC
ncbi:polysaccharide deacetylase family protein [Dermacoccaceae bacterium W4C1]